MHWKVFVLLTGFAAIVYPASGHCGPCEYILYPENFNSANYTFPNSVCIYPDGRTRLADAVAGNLLINIDILRRLAGDGQYYYYYWPDHGMLLGGEATNLAICGQSEAYLYHTGEMFGFFLVPIHGGGHSPVDAAGHPIASAVLYWLPPGWCSGVNALELYFNSPDIDGNLIVNLSDIVTFTSDSNGAYNYRSDFNWDEEIDELDYAVISGAYGTHCP